MFHSSLRHCVAHQTNLALLSCIESHLQCLYGCFCPSLKTHLKFIKLTKIMKIKGNKILPNIKIRWTYMINLVKYVFKYYIVLLRMHPQRHYQIYFLLFIWNIIRVEYYHATLKYNAFFDWICTIQGCVCVWFHKSNKSYEEVCHMYYNFEFFLKAMQSLISMLWLTLLTKAHNILLFTILNTKVDHLGFQFYGQHILYMDHLFNKDMIVHGFVTRGIYVKVMI
jgi:hypothetical protein